MSAPPVVPAVRTPLSRAEGLRGVVWALARTLQELPADGTILLCTAQWCLETGNGQSCYNFNPAGIKASGDQPRTYYATRERLPTATARQWLRDPDVTEVSREITPEGGDFTTVRVVPQHPACAFRAFADAESGFEAYVELLQRRFAKAWATLLHPRTTPQRFANELKAQGYYTASAAVYGGALTALTKDLGPVLAAYHADVAAPVTPTPSVATRVLYDRARALLATTVLYGPSATTVAWGDAA